MLRLEVKGERKLLAAFDSLAVALDDYRETSTGWQPHVDVRLDYERRHLDTEGAGGWTPLSEGYQGYKQARVGDQPILQFSGRMYRSLTEEGAPNYVRIEGAEDLKVGSSDPKAIRHHTGAGRLPKREVIVATPEEAQDHLQVFHDSYSATGRAAGFRVI